VAGTGVERLETPIIEDQELDAGEGAQKTGIAAVAAGQREVGEELGDALIKDRTVVAASLVAERCRQSGLADAGRAAQDQIAMGTNPAALSQFFEQGSIEAAGRTVIDVLNTGLLAQPRITQARRQAPVAAVSELTIEQQTEPFGMRQLRRRGVGFELTKGLSHTGEAELVQLFKRRVAEHGTLLLVIPRAADVGMQDRGAVASGCWRIGAVEPVFEDRADRAVAERADRDRPGAGGLQARSAEWPH
jgi:hypothetical protein